MSVELNPYAAPASATTLPERIQLPEEGVEITLEYELSSRDLSEFHKYRILRSWVLYGQANAWFGLVGIPFVGCGCTALYQAIGRFDVMANFGVLMLCLLLAMPVTYAIVLCLAASRAQAAINQERNFLSLGRVRLALTPLGIDIASTLSRWQLRWEGILQLVISRELLLIEITPTVMVPVPRSVFLTAEDETKFLTVAESYILRVRSGKAGNADNFKG